MLFTPPSSHTTQPAAARFFVSYRRRRIQVLAALLCFSDNGRIVFFPGLKAVGKKDINNNTNTNPLRWQGGSIGWRTSEEKLPCDWSVSVHCWRSPWCRVKDRRISVHIAKNGPPSGRRGEHQHDRIVVVVIVLLLPLLDPGHPMRRGRPGHGGGRRSGGICVLSRCRRSSFHNNLCAVDSPGKNSDCSCRQHATIVKKDQQQQQQQQ